MGTGEGSPRPAPETSLDSFRISGTVARLKGERWHPHEMAEILRKQEQMRIRVTGVDICGDIYITNRAAICRNTAEGRRRTEARIYSFVDYLRETGYDAGTLHFLTLTVRHGTSGSYRSMRETLDRVRSGWSSLRHTVKKEGVEYLAVIEPGERRGYPHLHLILAGASDGFCERLVNLWTDTYRLGLRVGQDWSCVDSIEHTGAYLRKYLCKQFDGSPDNLRWAELCYRERVRTFRMSRRASAWINDKYRDPLRGTGLMGALEVGYGEE